MININEFFWVLLFSITAELISIRAKIPSVLGMLIAGLLIGPFGLSLVHEKSISNLAELGAILLLFSIGIQFSIEKLLNSGINAILAGLLKMGISFILIQNIMIIIGIDFRTALIIASIFTITSTSILIRVLQQKNIINRSEVTTLLAMLVLEDITAIVLLTLISGMALGRELSLQSIALKIPLSLFALGLSYIVIKYLFIRASRPILKYGSDGTLVFVSLFIALLLSTLASSLGLSSAIGAFLAGSLIVALPDARRFEQAIKPFDVTLSSLFFISIGMLINPNLILNSGFFTISIIIIALIIVFIATTLSIYLIGIPRNISSAVFSGSSMMLFGEFSLLIAKEGAPIASLDTIGIASLGVLLSSIICPIMIDKQEKIILLQRKFIPKIAIDVIDTLSLHVEMIISEVKQTNKFIDNMKYKLAKKTLPPLGQESIILLSYIATMLIINQFVQEPNELKFILFALMSIGMLIASIKPLRDLFCAITGVCVSANRILNHISAAFLHDKTIKNLLASAFFFSSIMIIRGIFEIIQMTGISVYLEIPLFGLSFLFMWRAIVKIQQELHQRRYKLRP